MRLFDRRLAIAAALTFVVSLLTLACGDGVTSPTANGNTLNGSVMSFPSGAPVAAATVSFRSFAGTETLVQATTDSAGRYSVTLPIRGELVAAVNGIGSNSLRLTAASARGDLYVGTGFCIARYGAVTDERDGRPIRGASVTLSGVTSTTQSDGWYVIDLGCPPTAPLFGGTTIMYASRDGYERGGVVVGRGVSGVQRMDMTLRRTR